jgi:hypothetical protein
MTDFNKKHRLLGKLSDAAQALEGINSQGEPLDLADLLAQQQSQRKAASYLQECVAECRSAGISEEAIRDNTGTAAEPADTHEDD